MLLSLYQGDARTKRISEYCKANQKAKIQLQGCVASIDHFLLVANYLNTGIEQIYIAYDKEEAAYAFNNIENLLGEGIASFLPDSFKYPAYFESLNNNNVLMRNDAIDKLLHKSKKGSIIITYPEALFEYVVSPKMLEKATIQVKKGEEIDLDFLIEVLVNYGFERVDFVYEPGQFSIRGGIVDIFSYGNEWPYRVELFDEEVESIRTFDPMSQLSKQQIAFVSIVPNLNTEFGREEKVSFFETIPDNSVFWIKDLQSLKEKVHQCFEKSTSLSEKLQRSQDQALAKVFREAAFLNPSDLGMAIEQFDIVFVRPNRQIECDEQITLNCKPQPSFNRNFKLLIEQLEAHDKMGIKTHIFAYNRRQVNRFFAIFEDLNAQISFTPIIQSIDKGFIDLDLKIANFTDHQIFDRFYKYKIKKGFTKAQAMNLKMLRELKPGDYVSHIDHGVGRYSGLEKININGHIQESVRLFYKNNDALYVSINSLHKISKFSGKDGKIPSLNKLGSDAWKILKRKTKKKVKDIAEGLIKLYAKRKASKGFAFPEDGYLQNELEASFIFEDTPDQLSATVDVKTDMQNETPMDRLICGDVGFGKTEVAIRAAFKAVVGGKQVAILVPTTILALQHYKTISERLKDFPITIDYVNRFRSAREKNAIFEKLKEGKIDVVIGTHGLLNKNVGFSDLGLLVIDEEQKFGVSAKEKLRNLKVNVDTLTLTATPIPRNASIFSHGRSRSIYHSYSTTKQTVNSY